MNLLSSIDVTIFRIQISHKSNWSTFFQDKDMRRTALWCDLVQVFCREFDGVAFVSCSISRPVNRRRRFKFVDANPIDFFDLCICWAYNGSLMDKTVPIWIFHIFHGVFDFSPQIWINFINQFVDVGRLGLHFFGNIDHLITNIGISFDFSMPNLKKMSN